MEGVTSPHSLMAASKGVYGEAAGEWTATDALGYSKMLALTGIFYKRAGARRPEPRARHLERTNHERHAHGGGRQNRVGDPGFGPHAHAMAYLPIMFTRQATDSRMQRRYPALRGRGQQLIDALDSHHLPVLSSVLMLYQGGEHETRKRRYLTAFEGLPPGVNEVIVHCGIANDELNAITSSSTLRDSDRRLFTDPEVKAQLDRLGISLTNWKRFQAAATRDKDSRFGPILRGACPDRVSGRSRGSNPPLGIGERVDAVQMHLGKNLVELLLSLFRVDPRPQLLGGRRRSRQRSSHPCRRRPGNWPDFVDRSRLV